MLCTMSDHCEILGVIRHNRCLDLGNGSKKFGNHCADAYSCSGRCSFSALYFVCCKLEIMVSWLCLKFVISIKLMLLQDNILWWKFTLHSSWFGNSDP